MKQTYCFALAVILFNPVWLISAEIKNMDATKLTEYQADVSLNYSKSIGLPEKYLFLNGTPVKPLPPLQAAIGGVMIVGAYPSAVFERKNGRTIPANNLKEPFDPTVYGDSKNKSAEELEQNILKPLGVSRDKCWITNTVKVFLFKPEHVAHFTDFKSTIKGIPTRNDYEAYAQKSLPWLYREIEMAQPKVIITLGAEVAGVIRGVGVAEDRNKLLNYQISNLKIGQHEYHVVHFVHPGLLMRKNPKWMKIHNEGVKRLAPKIRKLLQD